MRKDRYRPAGRVMRPLLLILTAFPIAFFAGALVTDAVYSQNADMVWADFSAWLLALGMVMGLVAASVGAVALITQGWLRAQMRVWVVVVGSGLVLVIGFLDNLVHSRDAWTSVMPEGLALSAVNVAVILITVWLGFARRPVGADSYTGVRP